MLRSAAGLMTVPIKRFVAMLFRAAGLWPPGLLSPAAGHRSDGPGQTLEARLLATGRIGTNVPVQAAGLRAPSLLSPAAGQRSDGRCQTLEAGLLATGRI